MIKRSYNSLIFLFISITTHVFCQFAPHDDWYNRGGTCFEKEEFIKADSLFSRSIESHPNAENYLYRAKCRGKNADKKGYCYDLTYSSFYGNSDAVKLFLKMCGKIDTVEKVVTKSSIYEVKERTVSYICNDTSLKLFKKQKLLSQFYSKTGIDSINRLDAINNFKEENEQTAEFVGGLKELGVFITKNLKLPKKFNSEMNGKVFLRFIVFEDGSIQDVIVLKGISNCEVCNDEAQRVVAIMPKWKPAKINGKRVKCYFNLPISFKA
jgi:hypothetical protein